MAKVKNLKKKIRRLEVRLQKGTKKLAKLKQKLQAATPGAAKTKATSPAVKKVKRKLNLTPERRAQLAAAMKARWAAKRAAAATPQEGNPFRPQFSQEGDSQPQ